MTAQRYLRPILLALLTVIVLALPVQALAQSCALCYTQAASATQRFIAALRNGIIILIIPPMFMSIGITVLAYRKRNQFKDGSDIPPGADPGC
jgi:hypothetical protein